MSLKRLLNCNLPFPVFRALALRNVSCTTAVSSWDAFVVCNSSFVAMSTHRDSVTRTTPSLPSAHVAERMAGFLFVLMFYLQVGDCGAAKSSALGNTLYVLKQSKRTSCDYVNGPRVNGETVRRGVDGCVRRLIMLGAVHHLLQS